MRPLRQRHFIVVMGAVVVTTIVVASALAETGTGRLDKSEKMKQRLEQLFIWRVSDRLQLTPGEESKFTDQFKKLSEERAKLSQELESTLDKIDKDKENSERTSKLLTDYTSVLRKYNQVQSKEMDVMSKLFGTKKMVQYVLLKREMTQKFKDVLSQQSSGTKPVEKANLKEPEIIEQK